MSTEDKFDNAIKAAPAFENDVEEGHVLKDSKKLDDAARFLATAESYPALTIETEKKLVRKIDRCMIPLLLFTATLGAVDKVQISTASLYGFQEDTGMHGQQYSWIGSILSIGMLCGLWPASYAISKLPTAKFLCSCSLTWSVLTICYAACNSWAPIMALRFLMGMLEAVISPCIVLIISAFYKKHEQPNRNAIILSCFSSVINGFCSWIVGQIPEDAALSRWQYLYILTGSINILYSLFILYFLPDTPMNATFLNDQEKYYAVSRLAENRTGVQHRVWKWGQVLEAFTDPKLWLIFLFNIAINIPNGGLITFGSIIIEGLGYSPQTSALLTMPTGVMSTIAGCFFSWLAAKWHNRRVVAISLSCLLPLLGTALVYGIPRSNVAAQMAGLYLMYCYWAPYVTTVSLPQANTAGQTKKSATYSALYLGYAVGNLIGPQTFRSDEAPKYTGGVVAMLTCYCVCIVIVNLYWLVCWMQNRHRDRNYGKPDVIREGDSLDHLVDGFSDLTDKEQRDFRYTT